MSKRYLTIYNLQREKDWVLKNAYDIIETREINTVWSLEFSIPMNDQDMEHCQPYWYVRYGDDGQLYRITEQSKTDALESTVTYHCEHVISTLCDDVMFQGPYIKGNTGTYTNQVINFILEKQTVKNWKLGTCQPRRQFEYSWENENLLAALWSVPSCFATPYIWTFDTSTYPWKINLLNLDESVEPNFYLMAKKNILRRTDTSSSLDVCTRLYGLGEGEGVNQLTIKSVNNGLPYVQSSPEKIAEYGIVSRIFVDRRYQYPETLKARMETLLKELETPSLEREFEIVDLYDMSPDDMYKAEVGNIVLLKDDGTQTYITKTVKNWTVPGDMKITIATKPRDIASSIADLADRQRIEQVYSQGASQVYSFNFSGNATNEYPLKGYVYFPEDLKYLNEVKLKVKLDPFRSYSLATEQAEAVVGSTEDGGAVAKSTEDGGASTPTSESASATVGTTQPNTAETYTTEAGGAEGSTSTNDSTVNISGTTDTKRKGDMFVTWTDSTEGVDGDPGGNHTHKFSYDVGLFDSQFAHDHTFDVTGGSHSHTFSIGSHQHTVNLSSHSHKVTIPAHSHEVKIKNHSHKIDIPAHSHQITIPAHSHGITAGIFESGNPAKADLLINGTRKASITSTTAELDITEALKKNGKVPRGEWIEISIKPTNPAPDNMAYISVFGNVFAFIQSYTGGNY